MNKHSVWMTTLLITGFVAAAFAAPGGGGSTTEPEGMMSITPVLEQSCVAILVTIPEDKALSGVRWYNNDSQVAFPQILAACGLAGVSPVLTDGVGLATDVYGQTTGWSEVAFSKAVASATGQVYVIFQLPEFAEAEQTGAGPGFGYQTLEQLAGCVYLSAEGEEWVQLAPECSLLLEPVLEKRKTSTLVLDMMSGQKMERQDIQGAKITRTELWRPYPNPFNPVTNVEFTLVRGVDISLKVFDLRGRRVKTLMGGFVPQGRHMVQWYGDNDSGAPLASGVYFVKMTAGAESFSQRMLLLK